MFEAGRLEKDAQLFLLIFHTFVCNFFPVPPLQTRQICATDPSNQCVIA